LKIIDQTYKQTIKAKAKELGFIACGFAKYEVLEGESGKLRKWLDEGKQADMAWIERGFEKRRDVRHILPEARSVISLAFNYYTPFEHDESKPKISRYAWGKDYHKILKKKLKELCEVIMLTSPPSPLLIGEGGNDSEINEKLKSLNETSPPSPMLIQPGRDFENVQAHFLEIEGGNDTEIVEKAKSLNVTSPPSPLLIGEGGNDSEIIEKAKSLNETSPPSPLLIGEGGNDSEIIEKAKSLNVTSPPTHTKKENGGILLKSYVDDGPVMDKVWAQRAGIGWMGKHSNIINPEYGSWFFLCEIVTNIDFGIYDTPIEDMCGSCTLCISACPTGAIESEYVVDANKCISYQTIENRGEIPQDLNLDGWIFGCDVCQDVCPFNSPKYNHVTSEEGFWPKSIFEGTDQSASTPTPMAGTALSETSQELAQLTEEEFAEVFADSPIKRTKYAGWKRNLGRIDK